MSEPAPAADIPDSPPPRRPGRAPAAFILLASAALLALSAALAALLLHRAPDATLLPWSLVALLSLTLLLAAFGLTLLHRARWVHPLDQLRRTLLEIHEGDAPIDDLRAIPGPLAALTPVLQDVLHDLRRQRTEVAVLEGEMRQRIAHRTNALERTIGSLRQQATRDPLTGLFNRRMLDQYLPAVFRQCLDQNAPLALMMLDVDNFKLLNDTLGHPAGDRFLSDLADLLRSTLTALPTAPPPTHHPRPQREPARPGPEQPTPPSGPLPFRCGGDEFLLLLPHCDPKSAIALAQRLISLTDCLAKPLRLKRPPRLSIGLATLADLSHPTPEALLKRADQVLYAVKSTRHRRRTDPIPA